MANNNSGGRERRKPGIQALPEERKRGVTIRFLPEMKDDIYDLRDLLEREGFKGKKLLSQILKHQGNIDELLAKIKGNKKEEETGFPPLPNYEDLKKGDEIQALKAEIQRITQIQQLTIQERDELEELRSQVNKLKNLFTESACREEKTMVHGSFNCLVFNHAKRLLRIPHTL